VLVPSGAVVTLPTDTSTGNTVSYTVQRLCLLSQPQTSVGQFCARPQTTGAATSSSRGAGAIGLQYDSQIYYRITSRIQGPRNTVSYVQTIVSM
jgi:type IV pilus assembly protein PilX